MSQSHWAQTATGLLVPADVIEGQRLTDAGFWLPSKYTDDRARFDRPTAVGLFVGAGGMSCGLTAAGFHEIAALEYDASAALTYMVNLGAYPIRIHYGQEGDEARLNRVIEAETKRHKKEGFEGKWIRSGSGWISGTDYPGCEDFFFGDIRHFTGQMILEKTGMAQGEIDLVSGGPPCQGLSLANNKRRVEDPRNGLLWEYMRLVEEIRPKTFVIENVPQILTAAKGAFYKIIRERANAAGYSVVANVLNAADYGVPQNRRRAIIVGTREGAGVYQYPYPTNWPLGSTAWGHQWDMLEAEEREEPEEETETVYDAEQGVFTGGVMGERAQTQSRPTKTAMQASMDFDAESEAA